MIMQGVINSAPAFRLPFAFDGKTYIANSIGTTSKVAVARITFTLKPDGTFVVIRSVNNLAGVVISSGTVLGSLKGSQVEAKATITGDTDKSNDISSYETINTDKSVVFELASVDSGFNSSTSEALIEIRSILNPNIFESGSFDVFLTTQNGDL